MKNLLKLLLVIVVFGLISIIPGCKAASTTAPATSTPTSTPNIAATIAAILSAVPTTSAFPPIEATPTPTLNTGLTSGQQTQTAVAATSTAAAILTAGVGAQQTATFQAQQTATSVVGTQTAVAATQTAVAVQQTQTVVAARQTQTAVAIQSTQTSVAATLTAAVTPTVTPTYTPTEMIPSISSISPNPVPASSTQQTVNIYGSGFLNKPIVHLTWAGGSSAYVVSAANVIFVSTTHLQMKITTGATPDSSWALTIENNGETYPGSGWYYFSLSNTFYFTSQ